MIFFVPNFNLGIGPPALYLLFMMPPKELVGFFLPSLKSSEINTSSLSLEFCFTVFHRPTVFS